MTDSDKLLLAKTEDLVRLCDKYAAAVFSDFLDGGEIAAIRDGFYFPCGYNFMFFGGCDDCEQKILGVFPEWSEADKEEFPIETLKIEGGYNRTLTHRDYLGTLMSLGIDRRKTGDILVDGKCAYIFVYSDVAEYIRQNITKIGNQGVKITGFKTGDVVIPQRKFEKTETVCASARLDAVVGAAAHLSRQEAARLINGGGVKLNFRELTDVSKTVKEGDMISFNGSGRFILSEVGNETRKGRIHIVLNKYI